MDRTAAPNSREVQSFLYIIELTLIDANAILLFGQKKVKSFGRYLEPEIYVNIVYIS